MSTNHSSLETTRLSWLWWLYLLQRLKQLSSSIWHMVYKFLQWYNANALSTKTCFKTLKWTNTNRIYSHLVAISNEFQKSDLYRLKNGWMDGTLQNARKVGIAIRTLPFTLWHPRPLRLFLYKATEVGNATSKWDFRSEAWDIVYSGHIFYAMCHHICVVCHKFSSSLTLQVLWLALIYVRGKSGDP